MIRQYILVTALFAACVAPLWYYSDKAVVCKRVPIITPFLYADRCR